MHFCVERNQLYQALQRVSGAVEKRQTLPILANVLLVLNESHLFITTTDLEVEMMGVLAISDVIKPGMITVSARKLQDICRLLPGETKIEIFLEKNRLIIKTYKSRFALSTLPGDEFPSMEGSENKQEIRIQQQKLRRLLECSAFAMAQQDVRFFLNGMLLEICDDGQMQCVATDGHRLALVSTTIEAGQSCKLLLPRKAIIELMRLLEPSDSEVILCLAEGHLQLKRDDFTFTTKLIEGNFPDYRKVIPKQDGQILTANKYYLKQTLTRAAVLTSDKFKGVRFCLQKNILNIMASTPEQEEIEENLEVDFQGDSFEIAFNVNYLIDFLNVLSSEDVSLCFSGEQGATLIEGKQDQDCTFVIMPMRL